ncbi:hypothetical protein [Halosimplex halophilum]|uniref:hypothetical protein n=1 Tax=Halosimplex halophilum TaxID=2559572 RepID=UPI00107F30A0|nr:hypothetical protein [Halosimplex halophilum]
MSERTGAASRDERGARIADGALGATDRRQLLRTLGATVGAAGLAGCEDDFGTTDEPTGTPVPANCSRYTTLARSDLNGGATVGPGCYRVDSLHRIDEGTLTLEAGAVVEFAAGAGLEFVATDDGADPPRLETDASGSDPVVLRGRRAERGFWKGIRFDDGSSGAGAGRNDLRGLVVAHAGGEPWTGDAASAAALFVRDAEVALSEATVRASDSAGLVARERSSVLSVANSTFESNPLPVRVHPDHLGSFASDVLVTGNDTDRIRLDSTGTGAEISTDQTCVDTGEPYEVATDLSLTGALTVEASVEFEFRDGTGLSVDGGELSVEGTSNGMVKFRGVDSGAGAWQGIRVADAGSATTTLKHAHIMNAGGGAWTGNPASKAGLFVQDAVTVEGCVFLDNAVCGLTADAAGFDFAVEDTEFGANDRPMRLPPDLVRHVAGSNSFLGNDESHVYVGYDGTEMSTTTDATWASLEVPYRLSRNLHVRAPLEIEPGTTLTVGKNRTIRVENGYLRADAGGGDPVVFTGVEETPGHWTGLSIQTSNSRNRLRNVVVEYAGGGSGAAGGDNTKACLVVGWFGNDGWALDLHDATIRESAKHGISTYNPDLDCSNVTFSDIADANVYDNASGTARSDC